MAAWGVLLAVPLVVAIVVLAQSHWYPVLDLAQTELRIRDVASAHPPLIGLPGRIGKFLQGSHPGPISFWLLWPFYEVAGASAWAMEVAAGALNVIAAVTALWIAKRRGGPVLVLGVAAALAALMRYYGPSLLTQPWNPYMPMLWFVVFVLAVWSVLLDDLAMLPLAVFAGTFCVQTHISYAALVAGLGALAVVGAGFGAWRPGAPPGARARLLRWGAVALALGVVLWIPPVVQEITSDHGNLTIVWNYFTNPPESSIGLRAGAEQMLIHLNPWTLLAQRSATSGSLVPGGLVLGAWAASAVVAWSRRARSLVALDIVLAVSLVLGAVSISRIFGFLWYYLMLWAWGLNALVLLSIVWAAVLLAGPRIPAERRDRVTRASLVTIAGVAVVIVALFVNDASTVEVPEKKVSDLIAAIAPRTVRALELGKVMGGGRRGRYLVTYTDTVNIGAPEYALVDELERKGFDVGGPPVLKWIVTPHRVLTPQTATATVHFARGNDISKWRARPGYVQVAYADLRRASQRVEYGRLRARVIPELRAIGRSDVVPLVDNNLFIATFDPKLPKRIKTRLEAMLGIGQPAAVFMGPPTLDS